MRLIESLIDTCQGGAVNLALARPCDVHTRQEDENPPADRDTASSDSPTTAILHRVVLVSGVAIV